MKKVISLLLVVVILCSTFAGLQITSHALGSSGSCGENVTYIFDSSTGELVISGSGPMYSFNATALGNSSPFCYQTGIKTVIINPGVTNISGGTFEDCSGLTNVTIGNTVTSIGNSAFYGCSGLTSVTIPDSVTRIYDYAFEGCSGLTNVTIGNSVTSIGYHAFYGCGLTSLTIPDSVTSIGYETFTACSSLTSVSIPASVKIIESEAFRGCVSLERVDITDMEAWLSIDFMGSNTLLSYAKNLYLNGESVTQVIVPDGVEKINTAFMCCESLETIELPNTVTSIAMWAFYGCRHLKSISLPASVKEIGYQAFWFCPRLESITIENPDCDVQEEAIPLGTKIIAPIDSPAYEYARNYNMDYIELGAEIPGEHRWDAGVVTKPATCLHEGEITYTCLDCSQTKTEVLAKTGHQYQTKVVAPNCISQGFTVYTCPDCGDSYRADYVAASNTHDYKAVTTKPATCTQTGTKTFTCTVCGDKYNETIPMTSHKLVNDEAVAPTCTKYGLSAGKYCSACGKIFETQEKLEPLGHNFGSVVTPATLTANGVITHPCSRCNKAGESEVIYAPKSFALAKTSYVYSGKAFSPAVTVKDINGNVLTEGTDYSVEYQNNKNIGTASVVITFTGNYEGTKTLTFTILPKGTTIKLAAAKKAFTAKWTKVSGVSGYQIQYATNKKFTGARAVTVKGASKYAQAVKNLKGGAKYYVRIRTYKTVGGKNYYSAWSSAKTVTAKK